MKLNEVEMYNAHPWLLTVPRVAFLFIFLTLKHFPVNCLHLSEEKCNFA